MSDKIKIAFMMTPIIIALDHLLPTRSLPANLTLTRKYKQIRASIKAVGMIEPLTVIAIDDKPGYYRVLEGHIKVVILHELRQADAECILSTDDEAYTYNAHVNQLSSVQEHHMIRRAIERGVAADKVAEALDINITHLYKKFALLKDICPEAVQLLADKQFSPDVARCLRKMKPVRQIQCVELMISANKFTVAYTEALLAATDPAFLNVSRKRQQKKKNELSLAQVSGMRREMGNLQGQYKQAEAQYGRDLLNLVAVRGYLARLVQNAPVREQLLRNYPELLDGLEDLVRAAAMAE